MIVSETAREAWAAADDLIRHLDDGTIAAAQAVFAQMDSEGQRRMAALQSGRAFEAGGRALERLTVAHSGREIGTMIAHCSLGNLFREITIMAKPLLPDELWETSSNLMPKWTASHPRPSGAGMSECLQSRDAGRTGGHQGGRPRFGARRFAFAAVGAITVGTLYSEASTFCERENRATRRGRKVRAEPDMMSVFVLDTMDRLAQRQPNEQAKLAFTIMTGVFLGTVVLQGIEGPAPRR